MASWNSNVRSERFLKNFMMTRSSLMAGTEYVVLIYKNETIFHIPFSLKKFLFLFNPFDVFLIIISNFPDFLFEAKLYKIFYERPEIKKVYL